ncbi:MAG TPA: hypothetical protein VMN56_03870 [Casimicrobiaceae bacterium]|nr:hypothetical protein [Casimicrobiaceae bacterium]
MPKTSTRSADAAVEAAIGLVLATERAAGDAVEQATRDAAARVEEARADARAIAERAERRVRAMREAFAARAERVTAELDAEAAAQDAVRPPSSEDLGRVALAARALAAELTT